MSYSPEQTKLDASIVKEAAEVLQMVADSGVKLPPNWRWPLLDELSGIAYAMQDAATLRQQAARVDEVEAREVVAAMEDAARRLYVIAETSEDNAASEVLLQAIPVVQAALSAQPAERQGVTDEIVEHVQYSLDNHEDNRSYAEQVSARSVREALEAVWPKASIHPAAPVGVPDGYVLVPREPTPEMIAACIACWQERLNRKAAAGTLLCGGNPERSFRENWAAMLAAAPPAPQGVE